MKVIDSSKEGIIEIAWSQDNTQVTYIRGKEDICVANIESGEITVVGKGSSPSFAMNNAVVFEQKDQIMIWQDGTSKVLVGMDVLSKGSPKRYPVVSPDGKKCLFVSNNLFDKFSQSKNAYPYRHFISEVSIETKKAFLTQEQWYGGTISWFPDSIHFSHFEFDSTGGARIHIVNEAREKEGTLFGLYPTVSPDSKRIACKPRAGSNVVVYHTQDKWDDEKLKTSVHKLPEGGGRLSGSPPGWLDNRYVVINEGDKLWRVDTRKEGAVELKKLPVPTTRGKKTMCLSPSRELIAMEVRNNDTFELKVGSVI